ncbi:hypothetical protein DY000_02001891 [Brassica cretica]|uniref:Uncharacterized protein n=1 Tax=Brassica cretica TaxID=69181 RepID=A0ABQ7C5P8_BRACR|nr:hypothetical protein DY000_02001891 [Brassica cretica]
MEEEIFNEYLKDKLDLSSDPWPQVSDSAIHGLGMKEVRSPQDTLLDTTVLSRLKKFSQTDKLKKMALRVLMVLMREYPISAFPRRKLPKSCYKLNGRTEQGDEEHKL